MAHVWRPYKLGKLFTGAPEWTIALDGDSLRIAMGGHQRVMSVGELASLNVKPGFFWATLYLSFANGKHLALNGIPNNEAQQLEREVIAAQQARRVREQIEILLREFDHQVQPIVRWSLSTIGTRRTALSCRCRTTVNGPKFRF